MIKTNINISYNYGGCVLNFEKEFNLPFIPFYGLQLTDTFKNYENIIKLDNNEYIITNINYNIEDDIFNIYIRHKWNFPVSDETIYNIINIFEKTNWNRNDNTNIEELVKIMIRNKNFNN